MTILGRGLPELREPVEAALRGSASDLDVLHVRWALVGGFAVSVRTEPGFTRDVDVAVLVDGDPAAERLVRSFILAVGQHRQPLDRDGVLTRTTRA